MTIQKKLLGTNPSGGGATNVADVFSTYVYTGDATANRSIVNGIDLAGEGGMTWIKVRSNQWHRLYDTERGTTHALSTNSSNAEGTSDATKFTSFDSDGFTVGTSQNNTSAEDFVSWTFRKAPKFFDVVTYSGNSVAGHTVSHNLGSAPAMMIIKQTNGTNNWHIYHKNVNKDGAAAQNTALFFAADGGDSKVGYFNNTAPTDSVFTLGSYGGDWGINGSGEDYVAYLFADNSAEDLDDQMIKCGSYTGNGSTTGPIIDLGWEPQFILVKGIVADDWLMVDSMRGITADGDVAKLRPNGTSAEVTINTHRLTATGFQPTSTDGYVNGNGITYIYMAIRAPMMVEPESGTEVFHASTRTGVSSNVVVSGVGFAPDMVFMPKRSGGDTYLLDKVRGKSKSLTTNSAAAEVTSTVATKDLLSFDMDGISMGVSWNQDFNASGATFIDYFLKRAKGFFDIVGYSGTGSGTTVPHQLAVVPEMIWVKRRTGGGGFGVYHKHTGNAEIALFDGGIFIADTLYETGNGDWWNAISPTDTTFSVGSTYEVNYASNTYVAYLFATLAGVSKVGSYTGNGSSQTIDCGFAAGARFIFIKRTDASGDWYIWDTTRGIVAGNDPHIGINSTSSEVTSDDSVDPTNSGFIANQVAATDINVTSADYIFYAIA